MKKLALIVLATLAIGIPLMSGCGHNAVTYSDGIGLETTLNPETYTAGLNFRYGKILSAVVKEKSEVNLEAGMTQETTAGTASGSKTGLDTKFNMKTGDQVTGYVVELEKVKAANSATTATTTGVSSSSTK